MAIQERKWIKTLKLHCHDNICWLAVGSVISFPAIIRSPAVTFQSVKTVELFTLNPFIMKKLLVICVVLSVLKVEISLSTPSTQLWIPSTDFQAWKTMHLGIDTVSYTHLTAADEEDSVDLGG